MHRRIPVLIVTLSLVLVVRSDEALKCYMCTSLTQRGCDTDPQANDIEPVECTFNHMVELKKTIQHQSILNSISTIFDVDGTQNYQATAPMACAKMVFKVKNQDITVRNCQTAKTETIDPCKAIQGKISNDLFNLQLCELCMEDACNSSIAVSPRIFLILLFAIGTIVLGCFYNVA